jgi:thiol:disulfide interchange protein DsbD
MSVFLALGVGLALPYLLLSFVPALRSMLPRPGAWMEVFRQFLSFPMFLTAAWLIWVLAQQADATSVLLALAGMVAIAFSIWLGKHIPLGMGARVFVFLIIIFSVLYAASTFFLMRQVTPPPPGSSEEVTDTQNWEAFSPEKLSQLLETDQPVLTNMTAAWCITCKVNERVALNTKRIRAIIEENNIAYLKGDWTNRNAEIAEYLNDFGRQGVPLYVYYAAPDDTGQRPAPVVLPQILTVGTVEKILTTEQ